MVYGYDWIWGCMDIVVYFFSLGCWQDSCIIMWVVEIDFFNCIYLIIYEVGYFSYEFGIDSDYVFMLLGCGVLMGVYES